MMHRGSGGRDGAVLDAIASTEYQAAHSEETPVARKEKLVPSVGKVTILRKEYEGGLAFEVSFPEFNTMSFRTGARDRRGRIPLYGPRENKPFDYAINPQEATARLYHEARKFAHQYKGDAEVDDPYREERSGKRKKFMHEQEELRKLGKKNSSS